MASSGGIWGPAALRLLRMAVANTSKAIRTTVAEATKPLQRELLQPAAAPIRHATPSSARQQCHQHQPTTALLGLGNTNARWFSPGSARDINLVVRRCISSEATATTTTTTAAAGPRLDRSRLPKSQTSQRVAQLTGQSPFASTLRPNLTGGVLPRTAGGYALAGGARYFSHTPAAPAQVVENVSQAVRAFFSSGRRIQYDGVGARGQPQYRVVSVVSDEALRKLAGFPRFAPGAHIDFQLSPTITALGPLAAAVASGRFDFDARATTSPSLNTEGFLDVLSADFGRALKDLTAVYADVLRLSALGDLPISLEGDNVLRVRFPGVDRETVESLCEDIGIQRGVVGQDRDLQVDHPGAQVALRFPFAPDVGIRTPTSPGASERSVGSHEWQELSSLGDESLVHRAFAHESEGSVLSPGWVSEVDSHERTPSLRSSEGQKSEDFEGLEGIHRFLEECDRAKGRLG